MEHHVGANAALTVSLALAAGMVAQSVARHARLPGIVLLLAAGVLLGPDFGGVVQPGALGPALQVLVGFAVSVILFEGGMNLNVKRLMREAGVIQRLLTVGVAVTGLGSALAVHLLMGWDWRLALSFGALVIVTGPTVITPLLRRIKVKHTVSTVLEAEGVLIDAVGAVLAVVTLELVTVPEGLTVVERLLSVVNRLGFGILVGVAGGFTIAMLLRYPRIVPKGLENVFTLSLVLALFHLSNAGLAESGIVAVTVAGLVVGNVRTHVQRDLMEFKEQLTVMLIGMLFVLLAADVRLADLRGLGLPGVFTVLALMFLVRPLNILLCTAGSSLSWRERAFLSWLAPRGVVAAAVASLFAQSFAGEGLTGGKELQALVFMVIAGTVVIQGLSGGLVAQLLGLRRPSNRGYAIFGANELGHTIGTLLRRVGEEVIFLDSNPAACKVVEQDGFKVVYGNAIEERTLQRARIEERAACVAVTANEEANLLFARAASEEFHVEKVYMAVRRDQSVVSNAIVRAAGAEVLFGAPRDLDLWAVRLRRKLAPVESWYLAEKPAEPDAERKTKSPFHGPEFLLLPLVLQRKEDVFPVNGGVVFRKGDLVHFAVFREQADEARQWLRDQSWRAVEVLESGPAEMVGK